MDLDFTKRKYGLQLVILLITMLISGLIFQILGATILNSVFSFDYSSLSANNSSQLIMENKDGYWIFFILMVLNSFGLFILPSLLFSKLMSNFQNLSINFKTSLNFITLLPLFAISGIVVVSFMGELNMKLNLPEVFHSMEEDAAQLIQYIISFGDLPYLIATLILMAVLPAIGEELFFRGVLQKTLIKWTQKKWLGILITAFIFSAIHFQFLTFLPRFFMGIMLGYLFLWSRNLLIPILAHFLHNSISIGVAYYSDSSSIETPEQINGWLVLISAVIMTIICYRYYLLSNRNHV